MFWPKKAFLPSPCIILLVICDQMHSSILHNVTKQLACYAYDHDILHEIFSVCAPLEMVYIVPFLSVPGLYFR